MSTSAVLGPIRDRTNFCTRCTSATLKLEIRAPSTGERNVYLTTHSTHFIYGYMASDIWLRTILIVRKETRCRHIGYSYRLTARVILYAPSHRQDNTYHGLCYTSRGALAGTRNSSMGPPHEGSIRRPIAPWANPLPLSYVNGGIKYIVIVVLKPLELLYYTAGLDLNKTRLLVEIIYN